MVIVYFAVSLLLLLLLLLLKFIEFQLNEYSTYIDVIKQPGFGVSRN